MLPLRAMLQEGLVSVSWVMLPLEIMGTALVGAATWDHGKGQEPIGPTPHWLHHPSAVRWCRSGGDAPFPLTLRHLRQSGELTLGSREQMSWLHHASDTKWLGHEGDALGSLAPHEDG